MHGPSSDLLRGRLRPGAAALLPPVILHAQMQDARGIGLVRIAPSDWYQTERMACGTPHKPLLKLVARDEAVEAPPRPPHP